MSGSRGIGFCKKSCPLGEADFSSKRTQIPGLQCSGEFCRVRATHSHTLGQGPPPHPVPARPILIHLLCAPQVSPGRVCLAKRWRVPSPAEVAYETAALLIQETLPAVGCLHPALTRGSPVLSKEWHGTESGRHSLDELIDWTGLAVSETSRPGRMLRVQGPRCREVQGTGAEG